MDNPVNPPPDSRRPSVETGFTFVELLTGLAVVSMLAALVISTIAGAGAHRRNAVCLNNLRQIGLAMELYKTDTQYYPMTYYTGSLNHQTLLAPYLATEPINYGYGEFRLHHRYRCPEIFRLCQTPDYFWTGSPYPNHWGYGYNETINRDIFWGQAPQSPFKVWGPTYHEGMAERLVPQPSKKIAMFCNANGNKWLHYGWSIFEQYYPHPGTEWELLPPTGIHRGRENYLFCDGHVESIQSTERARIDAGWYADMKDGPYKSQKL